MCVKLNCCWVARIKGVNSSGRDPLYASCSASRTFWTPLTLLSSSATFAQLVPATRQDTLPTHSAGSSNGVECIGDSLSLLCSATTKVL
uniref:Uncharacterized protein n=1 Tax=Anguilla anguilla TaxID=7936 RepID=A0A0E9UWQ5_ANGAN